MRKYLKTATVILSACMITGALTACNSSTSSTETTGAAVKTTAEKTDVAAETDAVEETTDAAAETDAVEETTDAAAETDTVDTAVAETTAAADAANKHETVKQAFERGEKAVEDWFVAGGEFGKEEIQKATTFLKEHASELEKDVETVSEEECEKLTMAASFLEKAAQKDEQAAEHDIAKFATSVKSAARQVWSEGKEWGTEEVQALKNDYEAAKEKIEQVEEAAVDEFHKLVNKITE